MARDNSVAVLLVFLHALYKIIFMHNYAMLCWWQIVTAKISVIKALVRHAMVKTYFCRMKHSALMMPVMYYYFFDYTIV